MANFNASIWYQITIKEASQSAMVGTVLYDHGSGAVFCTGSNATNPQQQWQIFPFNSTYYVLRTRESGPNGFMNAQYSSREDTPGKTVPGMKNATLSDNSMFWQISPWNDGTFYLSNAANGTDWHLQLKSNFLMAMSSNITLPQDGQSFSFNETGTITDSRFSTVVLDSSSTTTTPTPTNSSPSSNPSFSLPSDTGLSTGAKAGIGAGVGVGVLLLLLLGLAAFLLRRKRRRNASASASAPAGAKEPGSLYTGVAEAPNEGVEKHRDQYELVPEMEGVNRVHELHHENGQRAAGLTEMPGEMTYSR